MPAHLLDIKIFPVGGAYQTPPRFGTRPLPSNSRYVMADHTPWLLKVGRSRAVEGMVHVPPLLRRSGCLAAALGAAARGPFHAPFGAPDEEKPMRCPLLFGGASPLTGASGRFRRRAWTFADCRMRSCRRCFRRSRWSRASPEIFGKPASRTEATGADCGRGRGFSGAAGLPDRLRRRPSIASREAGGRRWQKCQNFSPLRYVAI